MSLQQKLLRLFTITGNAKPQVANPEYMALVCNVAQTYLFK